MSNEFTVCPSKLKESAEGIKTAQKEILKKNEMLSKLREQLQKALPYRGVADVLQDIINNNAQYAKEMVVLQKTLLDAVALYESTEKIIAAGSDDSNRSRSGGGGSFVDTPENSEQSFWEYIGEALWQAIAGDFTDDGNGLGIFLSVIVGFIPYAGQIADIRDLVADIYNLIDDGPQTDEWVDLGFTALAFIPGLGDLLKHADKLTPVLKNLDDIVGELADATMGVIKKADDIYSAVEDMVKYYNKAMDTHVFSKISSKFEDVLDEMPDGVKDVMDDVKDVLDIEINIDGDTVSDFVQELANEVSGIEDGIKNFISDTIDGIFETEEEKRIGAGTVSNNGFSCVAVA